MDINIINGVIRAVGPAVVMYLVGKGVIPAGDYGEVFGAVTMLIAAVWSIKSNKAKAV